MNLKNHIEWNEWLEQYLLQQDIEMFDWKTFHEEEFKAKQERLSKMTQEEQDEEFSREVRELEALYGVDDDDYEDFNNFGEDDFESDL